MPDFSTRERGRGRGTRADALLLAVAFLAVVVSAYGASSAWAEKRGARAVAEAARLQAETLRTRTQVLESRRQSAGEGLASQVLLTAVAPPPRILAEITALMPPSVRLASIALSYGPHVEIEARIVAREAAAYDLFLKRLSESPLFEAVIPGAENRDGEVQATIQASYRGEANP